MRSVNWDMVRVFGSNGKSCIVQETIFKNPGMHRQSGNRLPMRPRAPRKDSTRQRQAFARAWASGKSVPKRGAVYARIFANGLLMCAIEEDRNSCVFSSEYLFTFGSSSQPAVFFYHFHRIAGSINGSIFGCVRVYFIVYFPCQLCFAPYFIYR